MKTEQALRHRVGFPFHISDVDLAEIFIPVIILSALLGLVGRGGLVVIARRVGCGGDFTDENQARIWATPYHCV